MTHFDDETKKEGIEKGEIGYQDLKSKQHLYVITSQPKYPPHSMNALHPNAGERSTSPCRKNIRLYSRINEGRHESGVSRESKDIREPLSILTLSLALI